MSFSSLSSHFNVKNSKNRVADSFLIAYVGFMWLSKKRSEYGTVFYTNTYAATLFSEHYCDKRYKKSQLKEEVSI